MSPKVYRRLLIYASILSVLILTLLYFDVFLASQKVMGPFFGSANIFTTMFERQSNEIIILALFNIGMISLFTRNLLKNQDKSSTEPLDPLI